MLKWSKTTLVELGLYEREVLTKSDGTLKTNPIHKKLEITKEI